VGDIRRMPPEQQPLLARVTQDGSVSAPGAPAGWHVPELAKGVVVNQPEHSDSEGMNASRERNDVNC
jgi:hypothetical protein